MPVIQFHLTFKNDSYLNVLFFSNLPFYSTNSHQRLCYTDVLTLFMYLFMPFPSPFSSYHLKIIFW